MGCFTLVCTGCNKIFDLTNENEIPFNPKNAEEFNKPRKYKCTFCGIENEDTKTNWRPYTIEEAIETTKCLQEGKNHKLIIGDVDLKIGDVKKCKQCGYVTDVVDYNGCMAADANFSIMCPKCDTKEEYDDWFEHCGADKCEMHDDLDIQKLRAEHNDFKIRFGIVKKIFEVAPPKNDGILELDRMIYMFVAMYGKANIGDGYIWVADEFMRYCAQHGLLTK